MGAKLKVKTAIKYLKNNKDMQEIKDYIEGIKLSPDSITKFLKSKDGIKILQPIMDKNFTKGLDTWRTNNIDKIVKEKVDKIIRERYPEETEEKKRLTNLEREIEDQKARRKRAEMKEFALKLIAQKKLPASMAESLVRKDEAETTKAVDEFSELWESEFKKCINEKFKAQGIVI